MSLPWAAHGFKIPYVARGQLEEGRGLAIATAPTRLKKPARKNRVDPNPQPEPPTSASPSGVRR